MKSAMLSLVVPALLVILAPLITDHVHAQRTCPNGATAVGDYGLAAVDARVLVSEVHPDDPGDTRVRFGSELVVREIRPGSAAHGLLRPDDVIMALDGALVTTFAGSRLITHPPIDNPVRFTIRRAGQEMSVTVIPRESCATLFGPALGPRRAKLPPGEYVRAGQGDGWLGLQFECPTCAETGDASAQEVLFQQVLMSQRPRVLAAAPGSPAARAGIRPGDVLVRVDDDPVPGHLALLRLNSLRPGTRVRMTVLRAGREISVTLTTATRPGG